MKGNFGRDVDNPNGGGMAAGTAIWMCAYCNNHWVLDNDITKDLHNSGFTKVMQGVQGHTITIF